MKEFDDWNSQQKILDRGGQNFLFKEGEIWWTALGVNIGVEICGKGNTFNRPVLILKKLSNNCFIGIPLSTKRKEGSWFFSLHINGIEQTFLLSQVRILSTNRFQRRFAVIDKGKLFLIKEKLEQLLKLS